MTGLSYNNKKVHVIFNYLMTIQSIALKYDCENFIFCFDSRNSYRELAYPDYKKNRTETQWTDEQKEDMSDMRRQRDDLRTKILPYMGFRNIFQQGGYEADDLFGYLVRKHPEEKFVIVARDEDLFQLLDKDRVILNDLKKEYTEKDFRENYFNLEPCRWAEVKAFAGCSSDNVKGIEKVGNITAAKYIQDILPKGKTKDKLETPEAKKIFRRNLPLVMIPYPNGKKSLEIEIKEDEIDLDQFQLIFQQYGFRHFLKDENWDKWVQAFLF